MERRLPALDEVPPAVRAKLYERAREHTIASLDALRPDVVARTGLTTAAVSLGPIPEHPTERACLAESLRAWLDAAGRVTARTPSLRGVVVEGGPVDPHERVALATALRAALEFIEHEEGAQAAPGTMHALDVLAEALDPMKCADTSELDRPPVRRALAVLHERYNAALQRDASRRS